MIEGEIQKSSMIGQDEANEFEEEGEFKGESVAV